ncbi:hypothetical protein QWM81_04610 [Streptomyces ficellus]|uniref:Integrase n=1 Tax=Streptomyces ficellus TaxID=1977088 RepID=A0ABT7Z1J7_9ACTN|nr:hypothetical protein [Streptomyces ficellus]MDN3293341.1 hypothetical protein [Streptomyces ficellus]
MTRKALREHPGLVRVGLLAHFTDADPAALYVGRRIERVNKDGLIKGRRRTRRACRLLRRWTAFLAGRPDRSLRLHRVGRVDDLLKHALTELSIDTQPDAVDQPVVEH